MSTAARKARKRDGLPYTKTPKHPTGHRPGKPKGLGLTTGAEILTSFLTRPAR